MCFVAHSHGHGIVNIKRKQVIYVTIFGYRGYIDCVAGFVFAMN